MKSVPAVGNFFTSVLKWIVRFLILSICFFIVSASQNKALNPEIICCSCFLLFVSRNSMNSVGVGTSSCRYSLGVSFFNLRCFFFAETFFLGSDDGLLLLYS